MAAETGLVFEGTFNNAITGLYKDNTTKDISEADLRALVTAIRESYLNRTDDAYTALFPQVTASGTDTYAATPSPVITAYATGQKFQIKFTNASSGVSTLNLGAIGAKKIYINPTTQATTGHIVAGQISLLVYDAALDAAAGGFLMIGAPSTTSGTVTSISPTTNRITVDNTDPAVPVIDIDAAYDAAVTAQIAAAQVGLWDDRGTFSAAGGAYPSSGGSGTAGAILKGDIWTISVAGTLPTGQVVEVGDTVRALIDTPGNTQANWAILQNNIGYVPAPLASPTFTGTPAAPTAAPGTSTTQLATTAFVQAATGSGAVAATGTAIAFATRQIYGDVTPETGNVTLVTTGLVKGMTQLLVHNHSSIPTFPTEFIIIWGGYSVNVDNYIMMYAKSASVILVTISQEL
jgi:hypothetical protein